jgi:hypothetical protein
VLPGFSKNVKLVTLGYFVTGLSHEFTSLLVSMVVYPPALGVIDFALDQPAGSLEDAQPLRPAEPPCLGVLPARMV